MRPKKQRRTKRRRRLFTEKLEDRRVLASLVGVDFDPPGNRVAPADWNFFGASFSDALAAAELFDIVDESGNVTPINLLVSPSIGGNIIGTESFFSNETIAAETLPSRSGATEPTLEELRGVLFIDQAGESITATYSDLKPGFTYEIYVFGLDIPDLDSNQSVSINGGPTFTQSPSGSGFTSNLWVNGQVGSNAPLEDFAVTAIADAAGEIEIVVTATGSSAGLGGLAIKESGIVVNSTADDTIAGDGLTTLREAIELANATSDADTITFGTLFETVQTIELDSQLPVVTDALTITGPGADLLTIDARGGLTPAAGDGFRHFVINDGDSDADDAIEVEISGLTLVGGDVAGDSSAGYGGAILNRENLTLTNSTLSGNSAQGDGGGLSNFGTATVIGSTLSSNSAGGRGGGISNNSRGTSVTVIDSTLSGNSAEETGGGLFNNWGEVTVSGSTISGNATEEDGGGIFNGEDATATVIDSTLSGNSAEFDGGALFNNKGTATVSGSAISGNTAGRDGGGLVNGGGNFLTVTSSTLSGNNAGRHGGGIYNSGSATVTVSTISGNSAGVNGGGIANDDDSGDATVTGSIIANSVSGGDVVGSISGRNNLIEDGSDGLSDTISGDPMLDALADNGGPTFTQALLPGSPAINAGDPNFETPPNFDQRGSGFDRVAFGRIDIGAFEVGEIDLTIPPQGLVVTSSDDEFDLDFSDGDLSLREAITIANQVDGPDTITFGTLFETPQTIEIDSQLPTVVDSLTITGPGADLLTIDAGGGSTATPGDGFRHFELDNGDSDKIEVELSGFTLTGGDVIGYGGSISNRENLTLTHSVLSGNSAGMGGGGITNSGTLTVTRSTLSGNSAENSGGGIFTAGTASVTGSTVSGNSAGANGGGIYNVAGTATVTGSTLSGNSAGARGGGIANFFRVNPVTGGTLTVTGSTLSGNSAVGNGGGIINLRSSATVTSSTLSGNSAAEEDGGGGISNIEGTLTVTGSIIANSLSGGDVSGDSLLGGSNLIADGSGELSDSIVDDPLLGPLADNGGATKTHALLSGSPAIDEGTSTEPFDQRGAPFARNFGGGVDIGAYERQTIVGAPFPLIVDTTSDENDGDYSAGNLSLREAIALANGSVGQDTITFGTLFETPQSIEIGSQLPTIVDALTITGPGANLLTIDAGGGLTENPGDGFRHFELDDGDSDNETEIEISGMNLVGGDVDGNGGAIFNSENLTLTSSTLSGNSASGTGGGIYSERGTASVIGTTLSGNSAGAFAGGISNAGTLTLTGSTLSGNFAESSGGGIGNVGTLTVAGSTLSGNTAERDGGGIHNDNKTASVIVTGSTISGNSAENDGGGIHNYRGTLMVTGSTLSGNTAGADGGGIHNERGTLTVTGSTLSGNTAGADGGGILNFSGIATVTDSIIANSSSGGDVSGRSLGGSNNLIEDGSGGLSDTINGDPMLGSLSDNGGPTFTHALLPGSPAINAGDPNFATPPEFDQRGSGFDRVAFGRIDIGSFEVAEFDLAIPPQGLGVSTTEDEFDLDFSVGDLSLREAMVIANQVDGTNTITFASPFETPQTIELDGQLPTISEVLIIDGPSASQLTIDANHQSRIFSIALGADATITDLTMTRGNSGTANGGAIENLGVLTLERVAITDSRALGGSEPSQPGQGGAIYNSGPRFTSAQRLTIKDSTVSGNQARSSGAIFTRYASTSIENSTISGNSADNGGAITLSGGFGSTAITNSTITDNTATTSAAGIQKLSFSGGLSLGNTILSGNQLGDGTPSNLSGTGNLSGQFNLLGSGTTTFGSNQVVSDDPRLSELADNGGPTPTHALLAGSPAIDVGDPDFATPPDFDQRGQGFARIVNGRIDVGALEAAVPEQLIVSTDTDEVDTDFSIGNLSLREAIGFANARPGPDTITFDEGLMGKTIVLESQLTVTDSITVNGLGADQLTIDGQSATRLFRLGKNDGPGTFRFDGLTLTGGFTTGFGGAFYLNDGFQGDDMLTITGSQLTGNTSALGGAISNVRNTVEIRDSSLIGNTASGPSGTRGGGAISNQAGNVFISDSTLGQNAAINKGGAIYNFTFEFQSGGPGANVTINNSTFAENQAADGSSIYNESQLAAFNTSVSYTNTIFSDASPVDNIVASSIAGTATNTSFGFNLSDDDSGNLTGTGDQPSTDPRLASLIDNGGSMLTYGLLSDSPATNAGDPDFGLASRVAGAGVSSGTFNVFFDQRGAPFQRVVDNRLDIGAFETQTIDFGDAPDSYRTTTPDGASHQATGPRLGDDRDGEINGQPSLNADGDGDDEDGVMFGAIAVGAALAAVNVELQNATAAKVDAWIDFNHDGDWNDEGEQILTSRDVQGGLQTLNFNLPAGAIAGETYARVRVSTDGGLATTGSAPDGEVEDYRVSIVTAPVVEDVLINDGESNRSLVSSINVNFDREISASPSAFQLVNQDTNTVLTSLVVSTSVVDGKSVSRILFDPGPSVETRADGVNSLADGNYLLTINGAEITDTGGVAMNGQYQFGGEEADLFFRLFGDSDGDGDVDGQDYGRFGSTFLKSDSEAGFNELFDADGDGDVDGQDYGNFGLRFLTTR